MFGTNFTQDDYEEGDEIVTDTGSTKQVVRVERKSADITDDAHRSEPGWDGEVIEVLNKKPGAYREEGDKMWGYDHQIERVR